MIFSPTSIPDCFVISIEPQSDDRGFFARTFCVDEFTAHGLNAQVVQSSVSFNERRGTLRGLHLQLPPSAEAKLVRCIRGAIFDVVLDLRPGAAFGNCEAVELSASNRDALYIPEGVAHGFLTLAAETEIEYQMSARYDPTAFCGVNWRDAAVAVAWPLQGEPFVSERDQSLPSFEEAAARWRQR